MIPTYIEHSSFPQGDVCEREDLKQIILHFRLIFPDWHESIEQVIAESEQLPVDPKTGEALHQHAARLG